MPLPVNLDPRVTVLLYSNIDSRHTRTGAWSLIWGPEFAAPTFCHVVLCSVPGERGVLLWGLDQRSNVVFDSEHETLEEAKSYAEQEYAGLATSWISLQSSPDTGG